MVSFLFPGQGAQYRGMVKDFYDDYAQSRELVELASEVSKIDLKALLFEGSEEDLRKTENTQIAIVVSSMVTAHALKKMNIHALSCAGFSAGEWSALGYAQVVSNKDIFYLIGLRGKLMGATRSAQEKQAMSAVIGLAPAAIEKQIEAMGLKQAWIANYNSASQCVLSGEESEIAQLEVALKAAGARRCIRLNVSGAFHCPLMAPAKDAFARAVGAIEFSDPAIPIFSNVTGKRIASGAEAKKLAVEQIVSPVRWIEVEQSILATQPAACLEVGPGNVLSGLWKSFSETVPCHPCGTLEQLKALESMGIGKTGS